ncbi:hypothetical protein [Paenibacillus alba]|uniref:Uncharacterized protein n=1 Tax=Paenibacillus alba TaxID=1197127 RepID=A0ABU6GJ33_9BACL|nr:hypothetical protein [Paenibacillus alba]MEC0232659.1 hypothetical protein [Paenibacillus alba]
MGIKVYNINKYWIAAESKQDAFYKFLEETDGIEYEFDLTDLPAGEVDELVISIMLLSDEQVAKECVPCCSDGCDKCDGLDEQVYSSFREIIESKTEFPAVVAIEE